MAEFNPEIIYDKDGFKAGVIQITWIAYMETGWGNGYISIPKDHNWYNEDAENIMVGVHGGLTFSRMINGEFWIGFDTAHFQDDKKNWPKSRVIKETMRLLAKAKKSYKKIKL